jgi:hypothetical protein
LRAASIAQYNEVHHHGLGMVYRIEVQSRLEKPLDRSQTLLERIAATEAIFDQAEQCFRTAHALDSGNDYPLVTHI